MIPENLLKRKNELGYICVELHCKKIAYLDRNTINWEKLYNVNTAARRSENRGEGGGFTAAKPVPCSFGYSIDCLSIA